MDRKEKILSYIKSKEYVPLKFDELMAVLDVPQSDREELADILDALINEGQIFISKRNRYTAVSEEFDCAAGYLRCSAKGYFAFLITGDDESDIFVAGEDMNGALNGDKVLVRIDKKTNIHGHKEGHVIKILERANKTIVGVICREKNGYLCVRPDSRQLYAKIEVLPESAPDARIGDRVVVSSIEYGRGDRVFGEVTEILGEEDSLRGLVDGIIIYNSIKQEFDAETLREADKVSQIVGKNQLEGREDLRDMLIFTIDGDDAKDFDDAVSLERLGNGNYLLGVHIADVTEYVKEGTALESEAYERGTSVYLTDRVIPMLPESLSNGICSLNPNVDRLTLSVLMEIDRSGSVVSHRLSKTVIRSKERMTYNNVNILLDNGSRKLYERYEYMLPTLKEMAELATILNRSRVKRGAIQFDFPESHVVLDELGNPKDIVKDVRGTSNKMIEEFMLTANETIAEYAFWSEIPFIYRSHEPPSLEKIKAFNSFLMRFGLAIKGKIDNDNPIRPKALQQILDEVKDMPEERVISSNMLQSLMKARYTDDNLGHFGLAAKYYCHFTSPIRRYPDLAIHRILKKLIDGKLTGDTSYLKSYTAAAALHSSDAEVNAEHTERDVDDLMKTAYMSRFVGKEFEGVIANVTNFGMFVELDNSVEGLVRLENMSDDFYEFDENTAAITGRRTGKTFSSGDSVTVVLARADVLSRQIDFVLENDAHLLRRFKQKDEKPKAQVKRAAKRKYKRK